MWVYTKIGFYSVVKDTTKDDTMLVRGRVKQDMKNLRAVLKKQYKTTFRFKKTPAGDYLYRGQLSRHTWATLMGDLAFDIEYDNFKSACIDVTDTDRHTAYLDVWYVMKHFQEESNNTSR